MCQPWFAFLSVGKLHCSPFTSGAHIFYLCAYPNGVDFLKFCQVNEVIHYKVNEVYKR